MTVRSVRSERSGGVSGSLPAVLAQLSLQWALVPPVVCVVQGPTPRRSRSSLVPKCCHRRETNVLLDGTQARSCCQEPIRRQRAAPLPERTIKSWRTPAGGAEGSDPQGDGGDDLITWPYPPATGWLSGQEVTRGHQGSMRGHQEVTKGNQGSPGFNIRLPRVTARGQQRVARGQKGSEGDTATGSTGSSGSTGQ